MFSYASSKMLAIFQSLAEIIIVSDFLDKNAAKTGDRNDPVKLAPHSYALEDPRY